jgi:hypothetical protein
LLKSDAMASHGEQLDGLAGRKTTPTAHGAVPFRLAARNSIRGAASNIRCGATSWQVSRFMK